ncbi:hypothetical protein TA3x_003493 [Tundrisphaera sp. TA3]|uniref:hypothetical protein n=1 Tax=Tundrisphaera sp. TA3 TaxID=3435775 RepID=UPI003EBFE64E
MLRDQILVSGFDINGIRVTYDSTDDTLNIGIQQPDNQRGTGQMVIAGDADNNGNSGTVNPIISDGQGGGIEPSFQDPADLGQSESMAAFIDLNNDGIADVIAGFPQAAVSNTGPKPYQVATAIQEDPNPLVKQRIGFGAQLPQYTGNVYLVNDPAHPNLEMQITNFSLLYQQFTGQVLGPNSAVSIGAEGLSDQNIGVNDAYFPPQLVRIPDATPPPPVPPPPVVCPPVSPPIYVNPHQNNHINTAHNSAIRVTVIGTSGFDTQNIDLSTVRFGSADDVETNGATPILSFENNINRDEFPDQTFVFNGLDVQIPPGVQQGVLIGSLNDGTTFRSSVRVFNRDDSFYSDRQLAARDAKFSRLEQAGIPLTPVIPAAARRRANTGAVIDLVDPLTRRVSQRLPGANGAVAEAPSRAGGGDGTARKVSLARKNVHASKVVKAGKAAPGRGAASFQVIGGGS